MREGDRGGDLIKQGKLTGASRTDVGRSELGIGIQAGAPTDIRTPEALKKTWASPPLRRGSGQASNIRR